MMSPNQEISSHIFRSFFLTCHRNPIISVGLLVIVIEREMIILVRVVVHIDMVFIEVIMHVDMSENVFERRIVMIRNGSERIENIWVNLARFGQRIPIGLFSCFIHFLLIRNGNVDNKCSDSWIED